MFTAGDYLVHHSYGLCRVLSVGHPKSSRLEPEKDYYTLEAVSENARLHVPVDCTEGIRAALTREEALSLIDSMPSVKANTGKDKERHIRLKSELASGLPENLVALIKEIYLLNRSSIEKGHGIAKLGEGQIFRQAESLLYLELAHALGCRTEEVQDFIKARLES